MGAAFNIVKVSGDNQTGTLGKSLTLPLAVQAINNSNPQSGVVITFTDNGAGDHLAPTL